MRGGQPSLIATARNKMRFSPRARGVNLFTSIYRNFDFYFPRMRGGQPAFFMKKLAEA